MFSVNGVPTTHSTRSPSQDHEVISDSLQPNQGDILHDNLNHDDYNYAPTDTDGEEAEDVAPLVDSSEGPLNHEAVDDLSECLFEAEDVVPLVGNEEGNHARVDRPGPRKMEEGSARSTSKPEKPAKCTSSKKKIVCASIGAVIGVLIIAIVAAALIFLLACNDDGNASSNSTHGVGFSAVFASSSTETHQNIF